MESFAAEISLEIINFLVRILVFTKSNWPCGFGRHAPANLLNTRFSHSPLVAGHWPSWGAIRSRISRVKQIRLHCLSGLGCMLAGVRLFRVLVGFSKESITELTPGKMYHFLL